PTFSLTDFYEVHRVVDGDTFEIRINDQIKKVRVIGINAPELSDYRKRVRCFAEEALKKAKELLSGRRVRLEIDPTQGDLDKFKRLLRFVFLEDGSDYGFLMIKEGFAYEYTYLFPHRHQDQYRQAQKKAQEERKGLWSEETCSY
ncbi:MAG: thermonuclease family protein, partial [Patescibacteria group bacterium]|nr:thermonuclease family protein [Patescibacteria group bacterium]